MDIDIVTTVSGITRFQCQKFMNTIPVSYKPLLHQIYNLATGWDTDEMIRIDLRSQGQRSRSCQRRHTDWQVTIEDHVVSKCHRFSQCNRSDVKGNKVKVSYT